MKVLIFFVNIKNFYYFTNYYSYLTMILLKTLWMFIYFFNIYKKHYFYIVNIYLFFQKNIFKIFFLLHKLCNNVSFY